jgi:polyphosphate kinase
VAEALVSALADNRNAWQLNPNGQWRRVARRKGAPVRSSHAELLAAMQSTEGDKQWT